MPQALQQQIPVDPANPYPLGRHVNHDIRSARFAYSAPRRRTIVSRPMPWHSPLLILNQGQLGSCVSNTGVEWLATDNDLRTALASLTVLYPNGATLGNLAQPATVTQTNRTFDLTDPIDSETLAVDFYSRVTAIDPFPGGYYAPNWDDTGSDGTSLGNLFVQLGLITSYTHAFGGLNDVLDALGHGPVWMGSNWYDSMFDPARSGELVITLGSQVAGGHEYLLDGELDVPNRRVWMRNHWELTWGIQGRAWMSFDTITRLLGEDGDATIPTPVTVPVDPPVDPTPQPTPAGCLGQFQSIWRG